GARRTGARREPALRRRPVGTWASHRAARYPGRRGPHPPGRSRPVDGARLLLVARYPPPRPTSHLAAARTWALAPELPCHASHSEATTPLSRDPRGPHRQTRYRHLPWLAHLFRPPGRARTAGGGKCRRV